MLEEIKSVEREKAILVGVSGVEANRWEAEEHLDELAQLAETAGADVVDTIIQDRKKLDSAYYIGRGKAEYLSNVVQELKAEVVIFDDDLTPAQTKNLGKLLDKKVIDRSALILDIFANRAQTREARTQVELAQLHYSLPRLTRAWTHLSRQVGGIGTRGPGETQLEVDRRLIRKRITNLERDLEKIEKQRILRRKHRSNAFKVALVGYTNVGKSTLLNALTDAEVFVENRLFATLDATVREMRFTDSESALLIDTVGFIRKLPHHLVASFRSTLEETLEADLLLHEIDISHPGFEEQIKTVRTVLHDLKLDETPVIHVFNKIDALENKNLINAMREKYKPGIFISASRHLFLDDLKEMIYTYMRKDEQVLRFTIHAADGESVARVYSLAAVTDRFYDEDKVILQSRASLSNAEKLKHYASVKGLFVETLSG
ncbi:MAG: GTPase HflX [Calditrichaeota bacterium]|nr:MAG: GTPase HflX [Calditrichota bacterium]